MEEVEMEVEAVEAVYGPDCTVLCTFPPHLSISLKPRTAYVLSIQFVEAKLIIKASVKYPNEPPKLVLKDCKGLGDSRHAKLLELLEAQAKEMSGEPMLVAICEAATDLLTEMNIPDGDCCFCMNPFVMEDGAQPFMKLMSCFHCFHSDCFGNWWRWQQQQRSVSCSGSASAARVDGGDNEERYVQLTLNVSVSNRCFGELSNLLRSDLVNATEVEDFPVNCPVCRMVVNAEDVAHVREFLIAEPNLDHGHGEDDPKVPDSVLTAEELQRRARFSAEFEAQQARGAIIEPKKLEVILPGMIVPPRNPPVEEQPPVPAAPEAATPEVDQTSPTSTSNNLAPLVVPMRETNGVGSGHIEHGSAKAHSHEDNGQASSGRRGGSRGCSHVGSRNHHGRPKVKKHNGQAASASPRHYSNPSRWQTVGSRKGGNADRGIELDHI